MEDLAARLRALANQLTRQDFMARMIGRYLLVGGAPREPDGLAFDTGVGSQARLIQAAQAAQARRILALEKSDRSPFSNISVGRTRNCDVVLREPSVSKLHAHFLVAGESWQLIDRGSANGTLLNGGKLEAHHPSPLQPGDQIVFGAVSCLFADGALLYRELGPA